VPAAVDAETGYRSYDERNLESARVIVALRGLEFSLDEIAEILADSEEDADIVEHLERQKNALSERTRRFRDAMRRVDMIIRHERALREEGKMKTTTFNIEERNVEPMLVAGMRMSGRYQDMGQGFATVCRRAGRHAVGKPMCLYYDGDYREDDADFEPCVPIRKKVELNDLAVHELPARRCVTLVHQGPYEELSRSYARIMKYAKERGYEIELPTREVYLKGPGMIFRGNPAKYLTEIQLPIACAEK
jgi:effector-binding domain-containing protein